MSFNIGVIIGPILGGVLTNRAESYTDLFGNIGDAFLNRPQRSPSQQHEAPKRWNLRPSSIRHIISKNRQKTER